MGLTAESVQEVSDGLARSILADYPAKRNTANTVFLYNNSLKMPRFRHTVRSLAPSSSDGKKRPCPNFEIVRDSGAQDLETADGKARQNTLP